MSPKNCSDLELFIAYFIKRASVSEMTDEFNYTSHTSIVRRLHNIKAYKGWISSAIFLSSSFSTYVFKKAINIIGFHRCHECKKWKFKDQFQQSIRRECGISTQCKNCNSKYMMQYRKEHDRTPSDRKYYEANKNKSILRYRKLHRNEISEWKHNYKVSDKGRLRGRINAHKRRELLNGLKNDLTNKEWLDILGNQNNICAGCGTAFSEDIPPEIDHIIPVSLGGETTKANIQALCRSCNASKGNKIDWTYPYVKEWT